MKKRWTYNEKWVVQLVYNNTVISIVSQDEKEEMGPGTGRRRSLRSGQNFAQTSRAFELRIF